MASPAASGPTQASHEARDATVAIVIPAYNAAATLAGTLATAVGQPGVAEIVVVDDGSTDATLAIARSFEPAVRVLTGPNHGVSAARNRGIAETRSEWLLFLDADDELTPGTIPARLSTAGANTAEVIICDWQEIIDDGSGALRAGSQRSIDWPAVAADAEIAIATHVWATTAAILYRRNVVERIGGFRADLPVIQDARFLFDAAYHGARPVHAANVGARYRVAQGSLSRRDPVGFLLDVLLNGQQIEALWRTHGELTKAHITALAGIYNVAARGLFSAEHPAYFEAVAAQRRLGQAMPLHTRLAAPLGQALGQARARRLLALVGRG